MTLEESIIAMAKTAPSITALVGSGANARVHLSEAPHPAAAPYIVVLGISGVPEYSQDGYSGLDTARFQLDCWATTTVQAADLASRVRLAFEGFQGSMGGGVEVDSVFIENAALDGYDSDLGLHRYRLDLVIEAHP